MTSFKETLDKLRHYFQHIRQLPLEQFDLREFQLASQETVVGSVVEDHDDHYIINTPLKIVEYNRSIDNNTPMPSLLCHWTFMPWFKSSRIPIDHFKMDKQNIISETPLHVYVKQHYCAFLESLLQKSSDQQLAELMRNFAGPTDYKKLPPPPKNPVPVVNRSSEQSIINEEDLILARLSKEDHNQVFATMSNEHLTEWIEKRIAMDPEFSLANTKLTLH